MRFMLVFVIFLNQVSGLQWFYYFKTWKVFSALQSLDPNQASIAPSFCGHKPQDLANLGWLFSGNDLRGSCRGQQPRTQRQCNPGGSVRHPSCRVYFRASWIEPLSCSCQWIGPPLYESRPNSKQSHKSLKCKKIIDN